MHLENYGLEVGKQASLVVLDAADPIDVGRDPHGWLLFQRENGILAGCDAR